MVAITGDPDITRAEPPFLLRMATSIRRNPTIAVGAVLLAILVSLAILAPWLTVDPLKQTPINRLRPPSERFWFGTDQLGRDMYSRIVYGARASLYVGVVGTVLGVFIGSFIGLVSGYFGGKLDMVLMRFTDAVQAFPGLILALAIVSKNLQAYGLEPVTPESTLEYDTITATAPTSLALIADAADVPVTDLKDLNPSVLRGVAPAGYEIHVPRSKANMILAASLGIRIGVLGSSRGDAWLHAAWVPGLSLLEGFDASLSAAAFRISVGARAGPISLVASWRSMGRDEGPSYHAIELSAGVGL